MLDVLLVLLDLLDLDGEALRASTFFLEADLPLRLLSFRVFLRPFGVEARDSDRLLPVCFADFDLFVDRPLVLSFSCILRSCALISALRASSFFVLLAFRDLISSSCL